MKKTKNLWKKIMRTTKPVNADVVLARAYAANMDYEVLSNR